MKVSVSALLMYWKCPWMYYETYIAKTIKREPPTIEMATGTAAHATFDFALESKMRGANVGLPEMLAVGRAALETEVQKVQMDIVDRVAGYDTRSAIAQKQVAAAAQAFHRQILPDIAPLESEMHFLIPWRDGVDIEGYIDCVEVSQDGLCITDWKVSSNPRTPEIDSAEKSVQLPVYALIYERITGKRPDCGALKHYVPSKRPHFLPRTVHFTDKYLKAIALRVDRAIDGILAGVFPSGDPYWQCNEKRCHLYNNCEMGAGV
jgi:hypothetical protein